MSILYIVATPIGNLEDLSQRALRILKEVDFILCEDTRHTRKLLFHYKINKQTLSYHQHSKLQKINYIIDLLKSGKNLALVSDAGTPGISDPGNLLIEKILERLKDKVKIIPIPGANAAIAALSASGLATDKFIFLGFPPHKNKRNKFFEAVAAAKYTVVFYESCHRIIKALEQLKEVLTPNRKIVVAREITKKFETIYRGNIRGIIKQIKNDEIRGEFVVMVGKK